MVLSQSVLNETALGSQIASQSVLNPEGQSHKRSIFADLLLTALIDAFSILVIFLLMNFSSTGDILFIDKGMELPKAALLDALERNTVIKFEAGKYFLENKEITQEALVAELYGQRQEWQKMHPDKEFEGTVIIQADRKTPFSSLNSVIVAMANTGYSDIRFAVSAK